MAELKEQKKPAEASEKSSEAGDSRGAILVVDDDKNHAHGTADVLAAVGYSCDTAVNGTMALEALRRRAGGSTVLYATHRVLGLEDIDQVTRAAALAVHAGGDHGGQWARVSAFVRGLVDEQPAHDTLAPALRHLAVALYRAGDVPAAMSAEAAKTQCAANSLREMSARFSEVASAAPARMARS